MKFRQRLALHLLIYIALCTAAFAQVVEISDPNLRTAVREALNLPAGASITQAAIRQLSRLDARDSQITTLSGLEYATNLTSLGLGRNNISNLTPLAQLTSLKRLELWLNPLANLTQLEDLDIGGCQIFDIAPLANLTQLSGLNLRYNRIIDISPLANLTRLTGLRLNNNDIIDVSPLANLTRLESLEIHNNNISDHSPLDGLTLGHFTYDETCDLPSLPVRDRIRNRNLPSTAAAWGGMSRIMENTQNGDFDDIWWDGIKFSLNYRDTPKGIKILGDLDKSLQARDHFLDLNPNLIFLTEIRMRTHYLNRFPEDAPFWIRDAQGEIVGGGGNKGLTDFTHPDYQEIIVQQALAVAKCGVYDGIFFDWWKDEGVVLANHDVGWSHGYRGAEAEQRARDTILQRIRAATRPDFLILVNTNRRKIPRTASLINGTFMETLVPRNRDDAGIEAGLLEIENTLYWSEQHMRDPRINVLEGWGIPTEPPDSSTNLRWMRAFTTLGLTHSDGYLIFNDGTTHRHYWYDFWDADLGRPVGLTAQLYEEIPGLYIREFTNGWAVYNHSGETREIMLPELATGVSSEVEGMTHTLPNLDGEMYLKAAPANPADVNGDGLVNILDLMLVAQGFGADKKGIDVNGDGVVNVFDLVFVADQF